MTSIHPLTHVRNKIQDRSVRRAFDQVTKGDINLSSNDVDRLFRSASRDNPYVKGDATVPQELADLQMIRAEAPFLFTSSAVKAKYDAKLDKLDELPKLDWGDDDGALKSRRVAINKVMIRGNASGYVHCPPGAYCIGAPSTVSIDVGDRRFSVYPRTGESSLSIARRLRGELQEAGFEAKVSKFRGASFVEIKGRTDKGLGLESLTTDGIVNMSVDGNDVRIGVGIGGSMALKGGQIGLEIEGKAFTVKTQAGEEPMPALDKLEKKIEAAGYEVARHRLPAIDTIQSIWSINKAGGAREVAPGDWSTASGRVHANVMELDEPIRIAGHRVNKITIDSNTELKDGKKYELSGRFDFKELESFPPQAHVTLTGVSNLTAGEPRFDGQDFYSKEGKQLPTLSWYPDFVADVPSTIFVVDQGNDKMFSGSNGGFIPQHMNPFHGFNGSAKIEYPTNADKSKIVWDSQTMNAPVNAETGAELDFVGSTGMQVPGGADIPTHNWYYDQSTGDVFRFSSGGFPGFINHMDQVVRDIYDSPFANPGGPIVLDD